MSWKEKDILKSTAKEKKMRYKIFFITLLMLLNIELAFADTVEIARVSAYYSHPITGVVEDSGKNAEIGQGMTESVLSPQALIETDKNGIYATFRFNMTDQISSIKLSKQKSGESSFSASEAKLIQSTSKTKDLRIKLDSKDSIIRIEAFVEPMGRAVVFYGMLGERTEGNTDFVVSVNPKSVDNAPNTQIVKSDSKNTDIPEESDSANMVENITDENFVEEKVLEEELRLYDEKGLLLKGDYRLISSGEKVHNIEDSAEISEEMGDITKLAIGSIFIVFGTVSALVFISSIFVMVFFYKIRRRNDIKEAEAYGFKK